MSDTSLLHYIGNESFQNAERQRQKHTEWYAKHRMGPLAVAELIPERPLRYFVSVEILPTALWIMLTYCVWGRGTLSATFNFNSAPPYNLLNHISWERYLFCTFSKIQWCYLLKVPIHFIYPMCIWLFGVTAVEFHQDLWCTKTAVFWHHAALCAW